MSNDSRDSQIPFVICTVILVLLYYFAFGYLFSEAYAMGESTAHYSPFHPVYVALAVLAFPLVYLNPIFLQAGIGWGIILLVALNGIIWGALVTAILRYLFRYLERS
jgi:hypothetical protein